MLLKFFKRNKLFFLVLFLSILGLFLRVVFIWKFSTPFTYDQGRDLLDIRAMILFNKITLIGPTTSLHGVFSGPFWYWLSAPFYLLTNGHPLSTEIFLLFLSFVMPLVVFLILKDKILGFISSIVYIFSYNFFGHSLTALNTNPMIFLTPLILICLAKFYFEKKRKYFGLALFLIGSSFHFEIILGILFLPIVAISYFLFNKTKKATKDFFSLIFLLLPLVPQILFDLRHDFIQVKAVLTLFLGGGSSLTKGEGNLYFRFFDRLRIYKESLANASLNQILLMVFVILIVWLIVNKYRSSKSKNDEYFYFLSLILISLVVTFFGFVLYPYALWPWYLSSVNSLFISLIAVGLSFFFTRSKISSFVGMGILVVFLLINMSKYLLWPLIQAKTEDPANLRNRITVVDLIYNDGQGSGMKIYNFAPNVYDYPYQYLIWWRAKEKYGYLPEGYAYLDNQPDYVVAKEKADSILPHKNSQCDYLIIEPYANQKELYLSWRGRFPEAKKTWEIGKTRVEKLCQ